MPARRKQRDRMDDAQVRALIEVIVNTESSDWDCAAVNDVLAGLVERELGGTTEVDAALAEHLGLCPPCAELHATLLDLARMEAAGTLPGAPDLWHELRAAIATPTASPAKSGTPARPPMAAPSRWRAWPSPSATGLLPVASLAAVLGLGLGWRSASMRAAEIDTHLTQLASQLEGLQVELTRTQAQVAEAERLAASAQGEASLARAGLSQNEPALDLLSRLDRSVLDRREDGAWLRVFYAADARQAVMVLGDLEDMPELSDGEYLECWLQRPDGSVYSTGVALRAGEGMAHWTIDAQEPMGYHRAFMVTLEPEHRPVFQVPLGPDG